MLPSPAHGYAQLQVACGIFYIPVELCELPRLQLLNLSHNTLLQRQGYYLLAHAPLHKVLAAGRPGNRRIIKPQGYAE